MIGASRGNENVPELSDEGTVGMKRLSPVHKSYFVVLIILHLAASGYGIFCYSKALSCGGE